MAKLTLKQQLAFAHEQIAAQKNTIADLSVDYQDALQCIRSLEHTIYALNNDLLNVTSVASALNAPRTVQHTAPRPAYVMPAWQVRRAEAMAEAKALAMSQGILVAAF